VIHCLISASTYYLILSTFKYYVATGQCLNFSKKTGGVGTRMVGMQIEKLSGRGIPILCQNLRFRNGTDPPGGSVFTIAEGFQIFTGGVQPPNPPAIELSKISLKLKITNRKS